MYTVKKNILKKIILKNTSNLSDAIKSLESFNIQIVLITNKLNQLEGILTDGDIRRALLKKFNLNTKIDKAMNASPITLNDNLPKEYALKIMSKNQIKHLPITNKLGQIKDLYILGGKLDKIDPSNDIIDNNFIIMAGGKGLRMRPLTLKTPKALLKINNKSMLEIIILQAKKEGFKNFIISIN